VSSVVVVLNIYDLSPANDYLYPIGFGLHHSGVEILGVEYSFASGGGIFESRPKVAPGAKFRESLEIGSFGGGSAEVQSAISNLRSDFGSDAYNLINKNCNHFANALVYNLLRKQIPAHVNRLANIGSFMSCLLPKKMLESAPVGDSGASSGFQVHPAGSRVTTSASGTSANSFSGSGTTLGSSSSTNNGGLGSVFGNIRSNTRTDDLTDRREKARMAALARLNPG